MAAAPKPLVAPPTAPPATRQDPLLRRALVGLVLQAGAGSAAAISESARGVHVLVGVGLFGGGLVMMIGGFLKAIGRSRLEIVDLATTFLLISATPRTTTRALLVCLVAQGAAAFAVASSHPYTSLAFSALAPMWSWGAIVLWSSRHAAYRARPARRHGQGSGAGGR